MTKKVLITGSREFDDMDAMIEAVRAEVIDPVCTLIIHGAARGADTLADTLANRVPGLYAVKVPAAWDRDGKRAGHLRNSAMLDLEPDVVLAFYKEGAANRGTQNCVDEATKRGIPVKVVTR